jgi:biopolymer transport protein ExbB
MVIYLDGIEMTWVELPGGLPALTGDMAVGGTPEGEHSFIGELDEIQLANTARSGDWVRAAYRSQGPEALLCAYGVEEIGEGGGLLPTFYLATVVKNVTLDGWVIIGLLILFAGVSWLVFFSKAFILMLVQKDNRAFLPSFAEMKDLTALDQRHQKFMNSSLFRIYRAGCRQLRAFVSDPGSASPLGELSPKAMNALRTALEKAFVEETQKLNAWLVILTMAITGGPFLGLLGTVWGVMNTFAAMAEAGEANIMAIAPGVASALATTVFGLIVAIPALFAYNYLTSRIKSITADMGVFVDEFAVRAEGAEGGGQ